MEKLSPETCLALPYSSLVRPRSLWHPVTQPLKATQRLRLDLWPRHQQSSLDKTSGRCRKDTGRFKVLRAQTTRQQRWLLRKGFHKSTKYEVLAEVEAWFHSLKVLLARPELVQQSVRAFPPRTLPLLNMSVCPQMVSPGQAPEYISTVHQESCRMLGMEKAPRLWNKVIFHFSVS